MLTSFEKQEKVIILSEQQQGENSQKEDLSRLDQSVKSNELNNSENQYRIIENEGSIERIHIGKEYSIQNNNNSNKFFIEYSYNEDQNKKSKETMEDMGKSIENFNENEKNTLFLLFDGHNGDSVSKYCRDNFDRIFKKFLSDKTLSVKRAITKSFLELDNELKDKGFNHIGSTGTIVYLTEENNKKIIYCGNVGDSRCTLFNKRIERLTVDHRVDDLREKERIINAGGFLMNDRVNGQLMLTRVFGDFDFKNFGVKCDPSVTRKIFDDKIDNQFMLISSDGIWDMFEEDDIKEFILETIEKNKDTGESVTKIICQNLIEESIKVGGWDNMSIFTIKLS